MAYMFQIVETEAQPILSVRTVTSIRDLPNVIPRIYGTIMAYLDEIGEEALGPAMIAYYNMDMEHLDVEIGFPVAKVIPGRGEIIASWIPAGRKAATFHRGSYSTISETYEALGKWMQEKGFQPTGVSYELYYNGPGEIPESEYLTQIQFPLE